VSPPGVDRLPANLVQQTNLTAHSFFLQSNSDLLARPLAYEEYEWAWLVGMITSANI